MDSLFAWVVKAVLLLMFAPVLICLVGQSLLMILAAVMPWVIGLAALIGAVAGVAAGLVLRRRLPLRDTGRLTPESYGEPIRRPKGRGRES